MTRAVGLAAAAGTSLPPEAIGILAGLTHLGDPPVLVAFAVIAYWQLGEERGTGLLSLAVGALALVVLLKALFGLPRPPVELRAIPADGYGFPSGHALGSAAVFGGLAAALDVGSRRTRTIAVILLVATVSFTRVGLGVHFTGDVIAGAAAGLVFLGVHRYAVGRDGTRGFTLALTVAIVGVLVAGPTPDALALLGLALGGVVAVSAVPRSPAMQWPRDLPLAIAAVPFAALLGLTAGGSWAPRPVILVAGAGLMVGVVTLPFLAEQLSARRRD